MAHTLIPREELAMFDQLKDLRVIIDVGARVDTDYLERWPDSEHHLFEPHPEFFAELKEKVGDRPNVYLNNYGLGDMPSIWPYSDFRQAFAGGECPPAEETRRLQVKTLDSYIKEHKIRRIDFLKVDVEGYDYKVFLGGQKALKLAKYIQYEHWDDQQEFHDLLDKDFHLENIGYRNVLGISLKRVPVTERKRLTDYIKDGNFKDLS